MFKDSLFNKIEKKTNISKDTILNLASKLNQNDLKDENNLKEIIKDISQITGKEVTPEKEQKIIQAIKNDKVPTNIDKMF